MIAIEAIARIRQRHCIHNEHCTCNCKRGNEYCEYGFALEALEKQIPKKPDQKTNESLMHINHGDKPHEIKRTRWEGLHCPACGGVVGTVVKMHEHEHRQNLHDFCPDCGQKIDWTEAGDTNG